MINNNDIKYMSLALDLARIAYSMGEVPVGAIILQNDKVIGQGFNKRELKNNSLCHAELLAISQASANLGNWRLINSTVYVTLEPCAMCAGALVQARIDRLVFGTLDPKAGAIESLFNIGQDSRLNHIFSVTKGVLAKESQEMLEQFFKDLRLKKNIRRV